MLGAKPGVKARIVDTIMEKALSGDMNAAKLIWEYMDGKPTQALEHSGKDGGPLTIVTKVPDGGGDSV
jgi:hypothetical protein